MTSTVTGRRGRADTKVSQPRKAKRASPTAGPGLVFARGQLWKTSEAYIQIMEVGKMLVHYRRAARAETRGAPIRINSKEEVQAYLRKHRAVLAEECVFKTARSEKRCLPS